MWKDVLLFFITIEFLDSEMMWYGHIIRAKLGETCGVHLFSLLSTVLKYEIKIPDSKSIIYISVGRPWLRATLQSQKLSEWLMETGIMVQVCISLSAIGSSICFLVLWIKKDSGIMMKEDRLTSPHSKTNNLISLCEFGRVELVLCWLFSTPW